MKSTDRLGRLELLDPAGNPVHLHDYWRARPVLLVFIRHFG